MDQAHLAPAKSNLVNGAAEALLAGIYLCPVVHAWLKEGVFPEMSAHVTHVAHALGNALCKNVMVRDAH